MRSPSAIALSGVEEGDMLCTAFVLDPDALRQRVPAFAAGAGLEMRKLEVFPGGIFAEFRRAAPASPGP